MAKHHYYLLASLPPVGELGGAAPLTTAQLLERVVDGRGPRELIEALLLSDDLLMREALLAGELTEPSPVVLTTAQLRDDQPLPPALLAEEDQPPSQIPADAVWQGYFRHVAGLARQRASAFLGAWAAHEVALRNALAEARAKALELDAEPYLVASELAEVDADFTAVLNDWSAAADPLAALRVVDRTRWGWLVEHEGWFCFTADELAAYAAKVMLLQRWRRLDQDQAREGAA